MELSQGVILIYLHPIPPHIIFISKNIFILDTIIIIMIYNYYHD